MGEEPTTTSGGIDRRELLKKGAIAGGLVWASPMVFSGVAGAQTPVGACTDCPSTRLFGIKFNNGGGPQGGQFEPLPVGSSGAGNCLGATASAPYTCFNAYYSFQNLGGTTHIWTLQPALQLCQAAAKAGNNCYTCNSGTCTEGGGSISIVTSPAGVTTVTINYSNLSHSEILFCYRGSPNSCIGNV